MAGEPPLQPEGRLGLVVLHLKQAHPIVARQDFHRLLFAKQRVERKNLDEGVARKKSLKAVAKGRHLVVFPADFRLIEKHPVVLNEDVDHVMTGSAQAFAVDGDAGLAAFQAGQGEGLQPSRDGLADLVNLQILEQAGEGGLRGGGLVGESETGAQGGVVASVNDDGLDGVAATHETGEQEPEKGLEGMAATLGTPRVLDRVEDVEQRRKGE